MGYPLHKVEIDQYTEMDTLAGNWLEYTTWNQYIGLGWAGDIPIFQNGLSHSHHLIFTELCAPEELHEMGGNSIALRAAMAVICATLCATDPAKMVLRRQWWKKWIINSEQSNFKGMASSLPGLSALVPGETFVNLGPSVV